MKNSINYLIEVATDVVEKTNCREIIINIDSKDYEALLAEPKEESGIVKKESASSVNDLLNTRPGINYIVNGSRIVIAPYYDAEQTR